MTKNILRGVVPILDTPFTSDGAVDYDSLARETRTLAAGGCDALALFGYASEFYTLTDEERSEMTDVVVEAAADSDTPVAISVTPNATRAAVAEAEVAADAGADALMVLPSRTRVPSQEGVLEHVEAVANAVDLPVTVQYSPEEGVSVTPDAFARLYHDVVNVVGFKIESSPPGPYVSNLLSATNGDANVLVGNAGFEMIEAFERGADGVMPASSMFEIYIEIRDRYRAGDLEGAVALHGDLLQMLNLLRQVGIGYEKRILARRGLAETSHCREPVRSPDENHEALFDVIYPEYVEPHIDAA